MNTIKLVTVRKITTDQFKLIDVVPYLLKFADLIDQHPHYPIDSAIIREYAKSLIVTNKV